MTTAWSYATHGQPREALRTHVTGTLLAVVALVVGAGSLFLAARGRQPAWWPPERTSLAALIVLAAMTLVEWGLRLL